MRNVRSILAAVATVVFCAVPVQAEWTTITISGYVTEVNDSYSNLGDQIQNGDPITGYYTYNATTEDSNTSHVLGEYWHYNAPAGIFLDVGGISFGTNPNDVEVIMGIHTNYFSQHLYGIISYKNLPLYEGTIVESIRWTLFDFTGTALSNTALPLNEPDLDKWSVNNLVIDIGRVGSSSIQGVITSVTLIPEPATVLLLAAGLLGLKKSRL